MSTVLFKDEWVTLTFDPASGLVRYTRSDVPYGDEANIERSYAGLRAVNLKIVPGMKLLLDVRLAPPRNDAAFEVQANAALNALVKPFTKYATLVRTAAGKLQTVRLARERGAEPHAFDDERAALDYLGIVST
ncbi:MAG: hypothetical protein ACLQVI_25400 [Polyangiaceae bacterium]|jgi:hypothetical protein